MKEQKADEPQTKETLANVLKLFYAEAPRKVDDTSYSKSTLNICSGICITKQLLKFIEYFPDYLSALSRTLLRFFGQPLSKQLYIVLGKGVNIVVVVFKP